MSTLTYVVTAYFLSPAIGLVAIIVAVLLGQIGRTK